MTWYYAAGSQQEGPVTEDKLHALVLDGVVTGDTLVWREGMANWQPYRTQVAPGTLPSAGGVAVSDPRPAISATSGAVTVEELAKEDYSSSFGGCFSRGLDQAVKSLAATYLAILPASMLLFLAQALQTIPFAGWALAMVFTVLLNNALVGGIWRHVLGRARGEPAGGGVFSGLQRGYFHLTVGGIVRTLLTLIWLVPGFGLIAVGLVAAVMSGNAILAGSGFLAGALALLAGLPVTLYLLTCWGFMLPLVADKGLGFWEAMQTSRHLVKRHWWSNFLLLATLTFIAVAPLCLIGLVFGPSVDFKDFKQLGDALKQGKLMTSPGQVLLSDGLGALWLWLISPFYFGVMAARYHDLFGRLATRKE